MYKKLLLLLVLLSLSNINAQVDVKLNLATAPLLIPNVGIEIKTKEKQAVQLDVLGSFWDEFPLFDDAPLHLTLAFLEYRWYQKTERQGLFAGPHIGVGTFILQKPNSLLLKGGYGKNPISGEYRTGRVALYGGSFGYSWSLNDNWGLEAFIGLGLTQSQYKGFNADDERTDLLNADGYRSFNGSGEVGFYRGGLMVVYKLGFEG